MSFMYLMVVLSTFFVYWDCTRNHIGKIADEKGLMNNSAGIWTVGTLLLWIVVFPLYLINRKKLIQKAQTSPQVVSSLKRNSILGLFLLMTLLAGAGQFIGSTLPDNDSLLADVSGVWRGSDGTIVTIDLVDTTNRNLQIQEVLFPVSVHQTDQINHVITVTATLDDEKEIWTIQKLILEDETFNILLTLSDGVQDQLTFVRNLQ